MKKLMVAMLGLSLLTGIASVSFAQDTDKKEDTKKTKKAKSKTKKTKKGDKKEDAPAK